MEILTWILYRFMNLPILIFSYHVQKKIKDRTYIIIILSRKLCVLLWLIPMENIMIFFLMELSRNFSKNILLSLLSNCRIVLNIQELALRQFVSMIGPLTQRIVSWISDWWLSWIIIWRVTTVMELILNIMHFIIGRLGSSFVLD